MNFNLSKFLSKSKLGPICTTLEIWQSLHLLHKVVISQNKLEKIENLKFYNYLKEFICCNLFMDIGLVQHIMCAKSLH